MLAVLLVAGAQGAHAQASAHADHAATFLHPEFKQEAQYDSLFQRDPAYTRAISKKCLHTKVVYGWHPAWSGSAYRAYDFPLLTAASYVGYTVDPGSGRPANLHQWRETELVQTAQSAACEADLTATCYGARDLARLLSRPASTATLRDSLVSLLLAKDADGVCLDFEGLAKAQSTAFTGLVVALADTLHALQPRRNLTVCLPTGADGEAYDAAAMAPHVDRFALLAYNFRGAATASTGPIAPLEEVKAAIQATLLRGAPADKLLLGLPYFGYKWPTKGQDPGVPSAGKGELVPLTQRAQAAGGMDYSTDDASGLPYWMSKDGGMQVWVDDTASLSAKFRLVEEFKLAGIAIWALGYDHGSGMYWDWLKAHVADCSAEQRTSSAVAETQEIPGSGVTSAERNEYNWVWMLGGGIVAVGIMIVVRRLLK